VGPQQPEAFEEPGQTRKALEASRQRWCEHRPPEVSFEAREEVAEVRVGDRADMPVARVVAEEVEPQDRSVGAQDPRDLRRDPTGHAVVENGAEQRRADDRVDRARTKRQLLAVAAYREDARMRTGHLADPIGENIDANGGGCSGVDRPAENVAGAAADLEGGAEHVRHSTESPAPCLRARGRAGSHIGA